MLKQKIKLHFKLPIKYNDGNKIDEQEFFNVKNYFLKIYGGLSIGNKTLGYWLNSNVEYEDTTIEYMVIIEKNEFNKNVEPKIKDNIANFKKQFKQLEILCYYYEIHST